MSFRAFSTDASGSVVIPFALIVVVLLGAMGLAVDFGRSVNERSKIQSALDAAVLAGASASSSQVQRAQVVFQSNAKTALIGGAGAQFTLGADGSVTGNASVSVTNFFARLYGIPQVTMNVAAKAKPAGVTGTPCVLLLDPSASQSLLTNSGADVEAPDCEFHVKSTANPAAIFNSGTTINTHKLCIQGSKIIDNGGTHPNLALQCQTIADPFAGTLPTPASSTCNFSNLNYNGGSVTLSPGVYCGWTNFNNKPNVVFNPGVYVIKSGGWNVNGGAWTGTGVTFYFADTSFIQFNSGVNAAITAPTGGNYDGIVMFEAPGLSKSNMPFDDSQGFNFTGLFYLPSRNVTFNGGSQVRDHKVGMVFNTLILNQTKWTLEPGGRAFPATSGGAGGQVVLVN